MSLLTPLNNEVDRLAQEFDELADELTSAVTDLRQSGLLPSAVTVERVEECRRRFASVCEDISKEARAEGLDIIDNSDKITCLADLKDAVEQIKMARFARQQQALLTGLYGTLDQVLLITHKENIDFPALQECQARARHVKETISHLNSEASVNSAELDTETRPFRDLLELTTDSALLDDDRWNLLQNSVSEAFGKALAVASARGKLRIVEPPSTEERAACTDGFANRQQDVSQDQPVQSYGTTIELSDVQQPLDTRFRDDPADLQTEGKTLESIPNPEEVHQSDDTGGESASAEETTDLTATSALPTQQQQTDPLALVSAVSDVLPDTREQPLPEDAVTVSAEQDGGVSSFSPGEEHSSTTTSAAQIEPIVTCEEAGATDDVRPVLAQSGPNEDVGDTLTPGCTIIDMVHAIRTADADDRPTRLYDLVWRLVGENKLGLAYNLAWATERISPDHPRGVPSSVLQALVASFLIRSSASTAVADLEDCMPDLHNAVPGLPGKSSDHHDPVCLLLFALSLRPALLAPRTHAGTVLEALPLDGAFRPLQELRSAILDYTHLGLELSPGILKGVRDHAAWAQSVQDLQEECRRWLSSNAQAKIIYAPTTEVWKRWIDHSGFIGELLGIVIRDARDQKEAVRTAARDCAAINKINEWLVKTDRDVRGTLADRRPIEARAKTAIYKRTQEAVALMNQWLTLLDDEPDAPSTFQYQRADVCRTQIVGKIEGARECIQDFAADSHNTFATAGSVTTVLRTLQDLFRLFDPDTKDTRHAVPIDHVLFGDLLHIPEISLDENWKPRNSDPAVLIESLLLYLEKEPSEWARTFELRLAQNNHLATRFILDILEATEDSTLERRSLEKRREGAVEECRAALKRSVGEVRTEIERAVGYDLLTESTRQEQIAKVENIMVDRVLDFADAERQLDEVRAEILRSKDERIRLVRERLATANIQAVHPEQYDQIDHVLQAGDFLSANEYIDMVQAGQPIPEGEEALDMFRCFFPDFVQNLISYLGGSDESARGLIRDVASGRSVGPLNMRNVPGAQAETAARMLTSWFQAKPPKHQGSIKDNVRELLGSFGLKVASISGPDIGKADNEWLADVQAEVVSDRDVCVIPQYGSLAGGRYSVLCMWERPSEDEIVDRVGRQGRDLPLIVLYFGRMTEQRRRDLANLCRERRRTVLVVDEALVIYLCGERGMRLPALFQCAFPFTLAHPYTTTAGLVPVEMFFGRERERESIIGHQGTNLVYGGRQLGKTALLRDVERRYHDRPNGSIVKWIDLKGEGIGINRPIDDIWMVISAALQKEEVLRQTLHSPDPLKNQIEAWLDKEERRRIVLLLDEADDFLESDSKKDVRTDFGEGYPNLLRLKGIMDTTDRRFKVVFAGLHNVQRTSRDPNTPIAHLGTPLCIGPLLDNGDWREALALITQPFKTLGYRFESDELPMRILSHTNYYPSLIQLFCKHLLDHLNNTNVTSFDTNKCPPYIITERHVEDAYQSDIEPSQGLRKAILYRFTLTLGLDPRYRIIALLIAFAGAEKPGEQPLVRGFDASWVRETAVKDFEKSFENDTSLEAFETILDEMIGLGVLRKVEGNRYTLRSPNVMNLLGTKDDIERALIAAMETEPPPAYEPAHFRRSLRDDPLIRSPLTAQQEAVLFAAENGVCVLYGSPTAGLGDVPRFLQAEGHEEMVEVVNDVMDLGTFRRRTAELLADRKDGLQLVVVPMSCPWSVEWILQVSEELHNKTSKRKTTRFVFLADPATTWSWVQADPQMLDLVRKREVRELSLKPWNDTALRRWLQDTGITTDDPQCRDRFVEVTGNWGGLLHEIGARCKVNLHMWPKHLDDLERELSHDKGMYARFGLVPETLSVLKTMAEMNEPVSVENITDLLRDVPVTLVERVIQWADLLSFARLEAHDTWRLDPVVSRIVLKSAE